MITKIIIIVMGLVTIVPHGDNDGMTVLLRDALLSTPIVRLADGTGCPVGLHVPLVLQPVGTCQGDCTSFNLPTPIISELARKFLQILSTGTEPTGAVAASKDTLTWTPIQESLQFDGIVPTAEPAPHDFAYSFRLGGGAARVKTDCLGSAYECPIVARLTSSTGRVQACSLSQFQEKSGSKNAGFVLEPFEVNVKAKIGNPLAEAYSIEITTNRRAPLVLTASNFSERQIFREASLYPDEKGQIVLLALNLPMAGDQHNHSGLCRSLEPGVTHSAALYDLATGNWGAPARIVPHITNESSKADNLSGGCSALLDLVKSIPDFLEYPSNPAQCKPGGLLKE